MQKYNNPQSRTVIPAKIKPEIREKIKELAEKHLLQLKEKGLSRVDFF